jgi:hypothetical protein
METCSQKLMEIPSVIAEDETVITERNGTWVLVLKYNMQTGSEQEALDAIDSSIISNNPVIPDRKLGHHPFRKKQPIESLNRTALSGQESRYKDFTTTPFSSTDSWSSKLFPQENITTKMRGGGGGGSQSDKTTTSNKTTLSIDDDTTVATLTDTVSNLQRSLDKLAKELTAKMETLGNKQATEEIRATLKIDALEKT